MVNNGHFDSQDPIWPIFKLVWDFIHVINIYKFHEDPTKNNEATLFKTSIMAIFDN